MRPAGRHVNHPAVQDFSFEKSSPPDPIPKIFRMKDFLRRFPPCRARSGDQPGHLAMQLVEMADKALGTEIAHRLAIRPEGHEDTGHLGRGGGLAACPASALSCGGGLPWAAVR